MPAIAFFHEKDSLVHFNGETISGSVLMVQGYACLTGMSSGILTELPSCAYISKHGKG